MGQTMDQMKMLNELRKAQKSLKNEIVEVEAGDGAVVIQITGELKIKKVTLDPERSTLTIFMKLNAGSKTPSATVTQKPRKSPPTR